MLTDESNKWRTNDHRFGGRKKPEPLIVRQDVCHDVEEVDRKPIANFDMQCGHMRSKKLAHFHKQKKG